MDSVLAKTNMGIAGRAAASAETTCPQIYRKQTFGPGNNGVGP